MNGVDKALKEFIASHAPLPLAKNGDIVITIWGEWKKPHKVKIYQVAAELVNLNLTIGERNARGITDFIGVELDYYANRVDDKGEPIGAQGIVLTNFITADNKEWRKVGYTFNHFGFWVNGYFRLEEAPDE